MRPHTLQCDPHSCPNRRKPSFVRPGPMRAAQHPPVRPDPIPAPVKDPPRSPSLSFCTLSPGLPSPPTPLHARQQPSPAAFTFSGILTSHRRLPPHPPSTSPTAAVALSITPLVTFTKRKTETTETQNPRDLQVPNRSPKSPLNPKLKPPLSS